MTLETVTRGEHEARARQLMSEAALCSAVTHVAMHHQGRALDELEDRIDFLASEIVRLNDRIADLERPPVAREQMRMAEGERQEVAR